jgi:hypothetical protein
VPGKIKRGLEIERETDERDSKTMMERGRAIRRSTEVDTKGGERN